MKKSIAAIDLGTNTFNLLIAEADHGKIGKIWHSEEIPVKLGEGGINQGFIAPAAFQRGLETIQRIRSIIDSHHAEQILAFATSAVRTASNGNTFIEMVRQQTGIRIQLIDGNREAGLIYQAVRNAVSLEFPALIMDIGGGSVEFILCDREQIHWKKSYPLGAARLREQYHLLDPIGDESLNALTGYLQVSLSDLFDQCELFRPVQLVGSAGAFETFEAIIRNEASSATANPAVELHHDKLIPVLDMLIRSTREEREKVPGLASFRIDMIVMASVLTRFILHQTGLKKTWLSAYSLKEGMVIEASAEPL
jgi:exopolyphosphatase / guanosine-5'-triphosphate,3'-diphosphate pyrophosphatase